MEKFCLVHQQSAIGYNAQQCLPVKQSDYHWL